MSKLFLGLDASTQSLSALVIDLQSREIVFETSVNYDQTLPHYLTGNGVLRNDDPTVVHAPPLMWVEALDGVLKALADGGVRVADIAAVSGSGQQHGSVYLTHEAPAALSSPEPGRGLAKSLEGIFSRVTSPVWMDSSTHEECEEIRAALGGPVATAEATGSTTFERFTGPQIRKFYKNEPEAYEETAHIALVSSFMASVLAGRVAPIDHGDGAGMNLMDIASRQWHPTAMEATAPGLSDRLPPLVPSWTPVGKIGPYFVAAYGFAPDTLVLAWSGDNPNSVIGLGMVESGRVAISLGTSDTYFGTTSKCRTDPQAEGHVFGSPTGDYMTLNCFINGSLARENVRDAYGLDWAVFSQALRDTLPGNGGAIMLPYFDPEIVPHVPKPGMRRFNLDEADAAANCRAVVEAQMMSMRNHASWMGERPSVIHATGGASTNRDILQIMADVNDCPVRTSKVTNSAALGAALRAAHGWHKARGAEMGWNDIAGGFTDPAPGSEVIPQAEAVEVYDELAKVYAACERRYSAS